MESGNKTKKGDTTRAQRNDGHKYLRQLNELRRLRRAFRYRFSQSGVLRTIANELQLGVVDAKFDVRIFSFC
jgi:hypothetical protein